MLRLLILPLMPVSLPRLTLILELLTYLWASSCGGNLNRICITDLKSWPTTPNYRSRFTAYEYLFTRFDSRTTTSEAYYLCFQTKNPKKTFSYYMELSERSIAPDAHLSTYTRIKQVIERRILQLISVNLWTQTHTRTKGFHLILIESATDLLTIERNHAS